MASVTIYHNPQCGTSRKTLAMISAAGIAPRIVHYLETPPTRAEFLTLLADSGLSLHEIIRTKEPLYQSLELDNPRWDDDALIDCLLANPVLINRPIVVTPRGARLCRPAELVLALLP